MNRIAPGGRTPIAPRKRLIRFPWVISVAVVPLYVGAVGRYGRKVLAMLGLSLLTGFLVDTLAFRLRSDRAPRWSWVIWVVFPLALSAGVPLWLVPIGLSFGLVFGLHLFGGYGRTLFPTAAVGIVFLALGYSTAFNITTKPFADPDLGFSRWASQIPLAGTVFADLRKFGDIPITDFLTGRIPGAIGESYGGYLILLGVVLLIAGFIDWRFVSAVIGGMVTFAWLGAHWFPGQVLPPHNQLLAGSFLLYLTVFVPSDPFALPRTPEGRWAGGLLFAFFTVMLRSFSGFAEGVWFAALLLAVFSPLIDQLVGEHLYRRPRGSA